MLKFSANLSLLFTERPLEERFAAAARAGFGAVEIQFPYELPAERIAELTAAAKVELVLFNLPAGDLMSGGEGLAAVPERCGEFRQGVALALDYARVLKPKAVNVLPGRCLHNERAGEYLQTLGANLRLAADAFAELGVRTVFEGINTFDMPGFLVNRGQQMLDLLAELNHPNLALQYDIYHMARMGEDPAGFIAAHAGKIGHIQFADAPGRGQPGTGDLDFAALFAAVAASGYRGYVGAEYRPVGSTEQSLGWLAG
ncbi:hydroxypyruvate isomerase family protein [Methylogaea oryzae]|uniref:Hydroxypyruvate isomerase n=1 Tax=Methylogaea oryzae TaxID=1295382 RepID=A0A8D4VMF2_9GAMM|nr:TIM barrel protein [Methylogaea oryzae]BBL70266.1 hydroxypyruvate isomerase [Methylogaea oryzae]